MLTGRLGFSTVKELERRSCRVFALGVAGYLAGVGLSLEGILDIGLPCLALSATTLLIEMAWITSNLRKPRRQIVCPHCAYCNDVFSSRTEFTCELCRRQSCVDNSTPHDEKERPTGAH